MNNGAISIFVDCHVFDKGFEGVRSCIQGLYEELIKEKNIKFYLGALNTQNLKDCFGEHENVFYIRYKSKSPIYRLLFDIPNIIRKHKIDFAHFQYRVPPVKLCKYIVTIHDVLFIDFPKDFPLISRLEYFFSFKYSAKRSDLVFTVSNYSKNQIQKHFKIENAVVLPNGIDKRFFEDFDKNQIQNEVRQRFGISNYIIQISRFEPRKNHHLLLKYFIEEKLFLKYQLVFVGRKTFKYEEFDKLYDNLTSDIKDKVKVLSDIEFSDLELIIKGASVAVYPSRAEGFGIPPLESIACGVRTICSNQTAMRDFSFLEEFLFNPSDELDFKRALNLITSFEDCKIEEKRSIVINKYNWRNSKKIFLSHLYKLKN